MGTANILRIYKKEKSKKIYKKNLKKDKRVIFFFKDSGASTYGSRILRFTPF